MKKIILFFSVVILAFFVIFLIINSLKFDYKKIDMSCQTDSDCIIGYASGGCCSCPGIYSKKDVDKYYNLKYEGEESIWFEKLEYSLGSCRQGMLCEMCPSELYPACINNKCTQATELDDIIRVCSDKCPSAAAEAAFRKNLTGKSIEFCSASDEKEQCFFKLLRLASEQNKQTATISICDSIEKDTRELCYLCKRLTNDSSLICANYN